MKVLFLSTLPREAPSVRPRIYAYLPALAEAGIEARVEPFLGSAAFRRFYRPGVAGLAWKAGGSVVGMARRTRLLGSLDDTDLVVIHREAVPRGNAWVLEKLRRAGVPFIYDFDDAIYLHPRDFVAEGEDSKGAMTRGKDPAEVERMIREARVVLAGNDILAGHARSLGAGDVTVLPTPVETGVFRPEARPGDAPVAPPLVGWIGSPTATYCLRAIAPALTAVAGDTPFRLLVIGASGPVKVPGVEVIQRDWALDREAADYASLDVGLYPLPDNPWTRGKCGYKALLYAASGVPCIASPVGVNADIVRPGETGFHARTDDEWAAHLRTLLGGAEARRRMGAAGRRVVEAEFAVDVLAGTLIDALRRAAA